MKSFQTALYKISFDENDLKNIVHIEQLRDPENYQSFFDLVHVVKYVLELKRGWWLSNKEAIKIINKANAWLIDN